MDITRYEATTACGEIWDNYGVVSTDGNSALRITADDYGSTTALNCRIGYRGENLIFNNRKINDHSTPYNPTDPSGRKLSIEVTPRLADLDARRQAIAVYAAAVFSLGSGEPLADIHTITGAVTINLR